VQTKANALRTKQALETPGMVQADRVKAMILKLVQLLQAYVPEDRHPQVKRELILMGAEPRAFAPATTTGVDRPGS
jgi:anti-sigma factor RsiW